MPSSPTRHRDHGARSSRSSLVLVCQRERSKSSRPLSLPPSGYGARRASRLRSSCRQATRTDFMGVPALAEDAESGAASVVLGDLGTAWTFATLNRAFRLLMASPDSVLIGLGATRYWRAADGLRLDVGPFVEALECASGR